LRFDYVLLDTKEHKEKDLRASPVFQEYLGLTLNALILATEPPTKDDDTDDRTDYIEEPVEERIVH